MPQDIFPTHLKQAPNSTDSDRIIQDLRQELERCSLLLERANERLTLETDERQLLVEKLHSSEAQMRAVFEAMTDIVLSVDLESESVNIMPTQAIGSDRSMTLVAELTVKQFFSDSIEMSEHSTTKCLTSQVRRALVTGETIEFEYSLTLDSGCGELQTESPTLWFVASISPISDTSTIWVARNITERKRIEQALFEEKELAQVTLQSIGDAVITTDATGTIEYFNSIAEQLTGWSAPEAFGQQLCTVFKVVSEETGESMANLLEKVLENESRGKLFDFPVLIARNGTECAIDESVTPIRDRLGHTIGAVLVFRDVTASRQHARQLSWEATHDTLTGLCNRRAFELKLDEAIASVQHSTHQHSLCYLDLDRFKIINDTCGHAAGDELLRQITALFQQQTRKTDTLARLGGDEFALLLDGCPLSQAEKIAQKLRHGIEVFQFLWDEQIFTVGVSIGAIAIDASRADKAEILSAADAACYAAKARGRNCVCVARTDNSISVP